MPERPIGGQSIIINGTDLVVLSFLHTRSAAGSRSHSPVFYELSRLIYSVNPNNFFTLFRLRGRFGLFARRLPAKDLFAEGSSVVHFGLQW